MKILIAVDSSPASQAAVQEIAARPWPAGSSFEVISVVEPSHLWTTSEAAQESARQAQVAMERAVSLLGCKHPQTAGFITSGNPRTMVLDRAKTIGADLVVTGSHGASPLRRMLLGSVAASVLRYATCSVEIVRARQGASPAMKLVLATDGSESSTRAARSIAARPWPAGSEIRVLTSVEMILPPARALLEPPFIDAEFIEAARVDAMKRAESAIASAREILSPSGLKPSESISVLLETPQAIILKEAADWGADLIVVGSHGHGALDRFLLGSVSEAVAMHAECSVEVIR